jgi:enoyl-CoA hydratase
VTTGPVDVTVSGRIAVMTLNRPDVRNALDGAVVSALGAAVLDLERDERVGAVVLTGAGTAFCAGFDLRNLANRPGEQAAPPMVPPDQLGLLPDHDKPIIGAVNGPAVTGGLELCLACDFLVASERARFADTHARVGAMPGSGLTVRLPELIGPDRARRMSFTGDFIDARTAYEWGLVTEVVPHDSLVDRANALAEAIASIPSQNVVSLRRTYAEIAQLLGPSAWRRENEMARAWMATVFDRDRLAQERSAIIDRGRRQP